MVFDSVSLAARIERAECRLLADCAAAIGERRAEADVRMYELAGGLGAYTVASSPLNKIAGLGFEGPLDEDALAEVIGDIASADGVLCYLARRDGVLAGGGSMRLCDGIAQLCGAATLPEHRRRGVQTASLGARLAHAEHEGCDVAFVTVQPGSKSQENSQRRGFELLYTRAILVRDA